MDDAWLDSAEFGRAPGAMTVRFAAEQATLYDKTAPQWLPDGSPALQLTELGMERGWSDHWPAGPAGHRRGRRGRAAVLILTARPVSEPHELFTC